VSLRLAIFGQARFGKDVTERLTALGHEVVGVWVPHDGPMEDPLVALARERDWPLHWHRYFRRRGQAIPEIVDEYQALTPDLNVLAFATSILPPEIAQHPRHGSICFHPSLLPSYRGGAALSWQIILGATQTGVSVFRIEEDVDCGPVLVQRGGIEISPRDTMASLYFDKLYPLGVEAMVEAVTSIAAGQVSYHEQTQDGASWHGLIDGEAARIDWTRSAVEVDRLVRGCDPAPGASTTLGGRRVRVFGGGLGSDGVGAPPGTVTARADGALLVAAAGGTVRIAKLAYDGEGKQPAVELGLEPGARFG
jgi:methionyl-tRNA formyltransferase